MGIEALSWSQAAQEKDKFIGFYVETCWGIVASQDCDAARKEQLTFFLIGEFSRTTGIELSSRVKGRVSTITKHSRLNAGWMYLPLGEPLFSMPMAIDFHSAFQISRPDLQEHVTELRKGRLPEIAYQHYREKMANYFRRYPYDEWYPLSKEEFEYYRNRIEAASEFDKIEPFPWQSGSEGSVE